jgi:hypothetical protein
MGISALTTFSLETDSSFLDIIKVLEALAFIPRRSYQGRDNSITNERQGFHARDNPWAATRLEPLGPRRELLPSICKGLLLHVAQERDMGISRTMPYQGWNLM